MKIRVAHLALAFGIAGAVVTACGSDDDSGSPAGGAAGVSGKGGASGSAGKGGSGGKSGSGNQSGSAGAPVLGGSAGVDQGGAAGSAGEPGDLAGNGPGGEGGEGGAQPAYTPAQIERGRVIVRGEALCGGCHTEPNGSELGGNSKFKNSTLPAPNLTNDATGIGDWTDAQVVKAFRDGIDDEGRHLDPIMPAWLFHNMSDDDAISVVAFLRSLPKVSATLGASNPNAAPLTPLSPSSLPDSTLTSASPDYAEAQRGKYLVSGVAQCVKCHSPSAAGLPSVDFFSGVPPTGTTPIFASNITPDATGISGWTAADVVTALKVGTNKASVTLCGAMPSAAKGYGAMTDADAHAIGVYLTTIPGVSKPTTAPSLEAACQ